MGTYDIKVQLQADSLGEALERMGELPLSFTSQDWQPWLMSIDVRPAAGAGGTLSAHAMPNGPYAYGGLIRDSGIMPVVGR